MVVRLASTSVEKGRKLLKDSGLPIAHAEALFDFPGPVLIFHQLVAAAMNGEEVARGCVGSGSIFLRSRTMKLSTVLLQIAVSQRFAPSSKLRDPSKSGPCRRMFNYRPGRYKCTIMLES